MEVKPTWGVDFVDVVARTSHAKVPLLYVGKAGSERH